MELEKILGTDTGKEAFFKTDRNFIQLDTLVGLGGVIESGSNASGNYIKFADGTLLCTYNATVTDQAITDAWGSMFTGTRTWSYPASFISSPSVIASIFRWGTGASFGSCWSNSEAAATMRVYDISTRAIGEFTILGFVAIGRWKA